MGKVWGGVLLFTGFIACPCHFPLTLSLAVVLLGGTAVGGFIAANSGLVYGIAGGYFIVALAAGWYLLSRKRSKDGSTNPLPDRESGIREKQLTT